MPAVAGNFNLTEVNKDIKITNGQFSAKILL